MADLRERIDEARRHVRVEWDEVDVERRVGRLQGALRRRRAARGGAAAAALAASVLLAWWWRPWAPETAELATQAPVRFPDGSVAVPLDLESELVVTEDHPDATTMRVVQGRGRFSIAERKRRPFHVRAGSVQVTVIGTEFTVAREPDRVGVWVDEGRVRVRWPGGRTELAAGSHGWFDETPEPRSVANGGAPKEEHRPSLDARPAADAKQPAETSERGEMGPSGAVQGGGRQKADARGTSQRPQEQPTWQQVARDGRYTDAFVLLEGTRVQDRAKDLMFAADVARLAGQHAAATPYLERVLRAHRSDAQAPLAAFTLGRLRLERLRKPHKAAQAFAKARALAPAGPLAEDALAREVEAWARAGATARARRRAERYLQRYPEGRRAGMVRRHGGLEP